VQKNYALIPVMSGARCIEMAGPERARRLAQMANVRVIRRHRDGTIVEIQLLDYADDSRVPPRNGNPLRLSTSFGNEQNPPNVWHHKKIAAAVEEQDEEKSEQAADVNA
jgi:hypothetical protein